MSVVLMPTPQAVMLVAEWVEGLRGATASYVGTRQQSRGCVAFVGDRKYLNMPGGAVDIT